MALVDLDKTSYKFKDGFTQRDGLILEAYEVIDENTIHIAFENLGAFCFLVNDTELNGKVFNNSDEFILELFK